MKRETSVMGADVIVSVCLWRKGKKWVEMKKSYNNPNKWNQESDKKIYANTNTHKYIRHVWNGTHKRVEGVPVGWETGNWQKEKTKQRKWRARSERETRAHVRNNKNTSRARCLLSFSLSPSPRSFCVCLIKSEHIEKWCFETFRQRFVSATNSSFPCRLRPHRFDFRQKKKRKCCNASRYKNRHKYLLRVCSFFCLFVCLFLALWKKKIHGDLPPAKIR